MTVGRAALARLPIRHISLPSFGSGSLLAYVARRLLQAVPLILLIIVLNFLLIKLAPGDPVDLIAPEGASEQYREHIRVLMGLDQPLPVQIWNYVSNVAHGDLGYSVRSSQYVLPLILSRVPNTLLLTGSGFVLSSVFGVLLGVLAARKANSIVDNVATFIALAGYSMPVFWVGQLLLLVFALDLGWLPAQGMYSVRAPTEGFARVVDVAQHLVLPVIAYAIYPLTLKYRLTRVKMKDTLVLDFITTARAKGLREARIAYRHALPNAFLPVLTVIGLSFGFLLSGSVLIETVFAWPGIGRLLNDAIFGRDYPVLLGILVVVSIMVIVANVITDILYAVIDPRVKYGRGSAR